MRIREDIKMQKMEWKVPIAVGGGHGTHEILRGPGDALRFMRRNWPEKHGLFYKMAESRCRESLADAIPPDGSRLPFVAAMIEADIMFV